MKRQTGCERIDKKIRKTQRKPSEWKKKQILQEIKILYGVEQKHLSLTENIGVVCLN